MVDSEGLVRPRLYIKQIDGDNWGIYTRIRKDGTDNVEVRVYPVEE